MYNSREEFFLWLQMDLSVGFQESTPVGRSAYGNQNLHFKASGIFLLFNLD